MDKKTQKILLFVGVGVVAYLWWKKREETSKFSALSGRDRRRKRRARRRGDFQEAIVCNCPNDPKPECNC
jgi:hypothetical protein